MSLQIVRRIRGNVHGTIDVSALENAVLDHECVQRLRRIRQLAFLHFVFPGASHTRFEHSLGVMHMAGTAWRTLEINQRRYAENLQRIDDFAALERRGPPGNGKVLSHGLLSPTFSLLDGIFGSDYHLQVLRLAALLHDVGHPPFSHSGERFLPSWRAVLAANSDAPDYLRDYLQNRIQRLADRGQDPDQVSVRHEVFSLLMVDKILRETYAAHPGLKLPIDPRDVAAVMTTEIEPARHSSLWQYGLYRLMHELLSGELDIDRMDYLLRDSRECGVVYGIFDAHRILDSLCLYYDEQDAGLHVAIHVSGLAAFEDYLRARHSMYLQVYFHKTSTAAEAMMQHLARQLGGWRLPADVESYAEIDEYNIGEKLRQAAESSALSPEARREFLESVKGVLYHRRLWKRVYEVSGTFESPPSEAVLERARGVLKAGGHAFEEISSGSLLTRFRAREADAPSRNYLRLIKKDEHQIPRVVPIEDHSRLIRDNSSAVIHRLYVADHAPELRKALRTSDGASATR